MMVRWLDDAVRDLHSLRRYIARESVAVANGVVRRVLHSAELLAAQPKMGRVGRVQGTRELVVHGTPYLIPYRLRQDSVVILRILHCAMQWPEVL